MDIINEVKQDSQILFDKRDVVALLEKQKAEDVDKACRWLYQHSEKYIYSYSHTPKCMKPNFVIEFEKAMKGE